MQISELIKKAHDNAMLKGFYKDRHIDSILFDAQDEISEARKATQRECTFALMDFFQDEIDNNRDFKQAYEKYIHNSFEDEITDAIIILFGICGKFNIDLEKHIELKMKYNETREYKHGKRY